MGKFVNRNSGKNGGTWNSVQESDSNIDDQMMFGIDWLLLLKFVQLTAKKGKRRAC